MSGHAMHDRGTGDQRRLADLAMLGHELRNPLAAALTGVATAAAMTAAEDVRSPLLARASRDLERLGHLLTAYLELLGGRPVRAAAVDLAALVRTVAARRGAAVVTVRCDGAALPLRGNAALLERALENMVDNALRSGARRVEIALERCATQAVVEISDDGPGVPQPLQQRLFDPFVSGRGSSGLGLVLVKDIAVAHGGAITLANSSAGARFVLTLPLAAAVECVAAAGAIGGPG